MIYFDSNKAEVVLLCVVSAGLAVLSTAVLVDGVATYTAHQHAIQHK